MAGLQTGLASTAREDLADLKFGASTQASTNGDVVEVRGGALPILRGSEAGELAKVVDEMGLIVIAGIERHTDPVHFASTMDRFQDALEPADAAEGLRIDTDLFVEELDEPALAEADSTEYRGDSDFMGPSAELAARKVDRGMQFQWLCELIQKESFGDRKHRIDGGSR